MHINSLGELTVDPDIEEWLVSQPVSIAYFSGEKVPFVLEGIAGPATPETFEKAIGAFLKLDEPSREAATPHVYRNYLDFAEAVDEEDVPVHIERPEDVWQFVRPIDVHVRTGDDSQVYVLVQAECDWEIEHGLQLVFRGGSELTRVSAQDGDLTD